MKISVVDARAFAEALTAGANEAMSRGEHEFELVSTLQAIDNAARDDLQKSIEAARNT